MIKTIKKYLVSMLAVIMFATPMVATSAVVSAQTPTDPQIPQSLCQGSSLQFNNGSNQADCKQQGSEATTKVNDLVGQIINIFSVIVGIVAVIMIIIGGFRYITSGGDSGNVTGAKNTILYAVIGLVIVALAQFVVKFVLSKVTVTNP